MLYDIPFEIGDFVTVKAQVSPFLEEVVKIQEFHISKRGISCDVWHSHGRTNAFFIRTYAISGLKKASKPDFWDKYCTKYQYDFLI